MFLHFQPPLAGCGYFVDAMSSFGAVPLDMQSAGVDYLVSSANKCLEGVPGFSFVIANIEHLTSTAGKFENSDQPFLHKNETSWLHWRTICNFSCIIYS